MWRNLEKFIKYLAHKDQQNIVMKWESKFLFVEMKTELHEHSNNHSSRQAEIISERERRCSALSIDTERGWNAPKNVGLTAIYIFTSIDFYTFGWLMTIFDQSVWRLQYLIWHLYGFFDPQFLSFLRHWVAILWSFLWPIQDPKPLFRDQMCGLRVNGPPGNLLDKLGSRKWLSCPGPESFMTYQTRGTFLWMPGNGNKKYSFQLMKWDAYLRRKTLKLKKKKKKRTKVSRVLHLLSKNLFFCNGSHMKHQRGEVSAKDLVDF